MDAYAKYGLGCSCIYLLSGGARGDGDGDGDEI